MKLLLILLNLIIISQEISLRNGLIKKYKEKVRWQSHAKHQTKISMAVKIRVKQAKVYKSYCAEQMAPMVAKLKCGDDCFDPTISFIEFCGFNTIDGMCPDYTPNYCTIDIHSKMNDICKGKSECKTQVDEKTFGKLDQCFGSAFKCLFTCECSFQQPMPLKLKQLSTEDKKNFIKQMIRIYSKNEKFYMMLDKDANLQVFDIEGKSSFETGSKKSNGTEPFILEITQSGDFAIKDDTDKIVWNTATADKGKKPFVITVSDEGKILLKDGEQTELWKSK